MVRNKNQFVVGTNNIIHTKTTIGTLLNGRSPIKKTRKTGESDSSSGSNNSSAAAAAASTSHGGVVRSGSATTLTVASSAGTFIYQHPPPRAGSSGSLPSSSSSSTASSSPRSSVHKQNFYIVSYPIVLLFNILRALLYQLFIIFKYIFTAGTRIVYRPVRLRRADCKLELVTDDGGGHRLQQQQQLIGANEIIQMSSAAGAPVKSSSPGPGDPLLAKQKHHHRRAFEYISKALKIDEENEGETERDESQKKD